MKKVIEWEQQGCDGWLSFLFARRDAETTAIGCYAELNDIKIIIIHPITVLCWLRLLLLRWLRLCLRWLRLCLHWLRLCRRLCVHLEFSSCIELTFGPDGINFFNNWFKRNQHDYIIT